ncbi:MAG: M20/M25/M40 family metallo-hydrolase [Bacteroidota bacterium]|nr:M20/M25/M40 family metallo-hydrolase [Bacteroidota bacterium]
MLNRFCSIIFINILILSTILGQDKNYFTVEIAFKPEQSAEYLQELIPTFRITSQTENSVVGEISSRDFSSIRSGEYVYKVLSVPKSVYHSPQISKQVGVANPHIQTMVNKVSTDTLRQQILALQNFGTRYEYTPQQDSAGVYIYNQFVSWGLQAEYDTYTFGIHTVTIYDIDFVDENTGWLVGTNGMIVKTTDGGESWFSQISGTGLHLFGVDFINSQIGWVVGNSGLILKTTNGGERWISQTSGQAVALYDVNFVNDQLGLIVGASGRIFRTTNGGTNWSSIFSGTTQTLRELQFVDILNAWTVGSSGTILRTTDGGISWSSQLPPAGITTYLRAVSFINNQDGWIVGDGLVILKTTNGGVNWVQQYAPLGVENTLRGVSFINSQTGWVVDYAGIIIKTTNGGDSWAVQYSHLGWNAKLTNVKATSNNLVTVCGVSGNLYKTSDGGLNWLRRTSSLPPQYIHTSSNIVATIPGTVSPEKECIIVAHYDSYSNNPYVAAPGANDNGTGTAAVMEAARLCKDFGFENTIRFIAVSAEEHGMFGSDFYAFKARDEGRNIIGVVNGDMIGYPTTSDTARLITGSYQTLNRLVDSAGIYNQRYNIGLTVVPVIDNTGASDYGPFALAGYDALDIAEGTVEEIWGGADPYYHTVNDTYDKLKPSLIRQGTQLMLATVAELAKPFIRGTVSGKVYLDLDRDSSTVGDSTLQGWVIKVYKDGILQRRTTTDENGDYFISDLLPQTYTVEESLYHNWTQSFPHVAAPGVTYSTYGANAGTRAYTLNLNSNPIAINKDFANYPHNLLMQKFQYNLGWNMVSVPLGVANYEKENIFPNAISNAYRYENSYFESDTLDNGIGFWLKFPTITDVKMVGSIISCDTIDLNVGWNLIGSISEPISISSLVTIPEGILANKIYEYSNGYRITETLVPGRAYWIKANSAGELILCGSTSKNLKD